MTYYMQKENESKILKRIEELKEVYIQCMEMRDWQSCDFVADAISIERAKIGITGLKHPLEEDKV
ncbi:hypothetical protein HWD03_gp128 [Alteromonas phage vB_AmeM_PT11-V22]|uniref:Uncharacterized protein n=1 Tax=Alteromonas phage vB_AmeM_PT11-V22 TaxID=2704031 RepID=A0A6C0R0Y3_9CAUD|nr:hypothetical protein HWD03_gp128 [Alteromonas phage vB_AmeM_PT11-V22]QHZ59858.1 hypothetical protein [Alteromonas phage vB_AmeM_PT11-V22]